MAPGHPGATCTGGAEQREVGEGPVQGTFLEERHGFLQPATPHANPPRGVGVCEPEKLPKQNKTLDGCQNKHASRSAWAILANSVPFHDLGSDALILVTWLDISWQF